VQHDASGRYGLETRFSDNLGGHFAGGEWRADALHNTLATVTNGGTKAADALLTLHYDNGTKAYEMRQTLQPGGQMWVNFADLIHRRVADRKGNVLPADLTSATYDLQDLSPAPGSLLPSALALDSTSGYQAQPRLATCCGFLNPGWNPDAFDILEDGTDVFDIVAVDSCNETFYDIFDDFTDFSSGNAAIAQVTAGKETGVSPGVTTGYAYGEVWEGIGTNCAMVPVEVEAPITVAIPTSETTTLYGTYQYTEGSFVMTLNPGTGSYDGNYVTESNYATGTDTCYWPGANLANPPSVVGSTWTVGENGSAHNQYGVDSIGFNLTGVQYIQENGGWPRLLDFRFSPPVPKLWVPRSCVFCKGGYDAADSSVSSISSESLEPRAFTADGRVPALRNVREERGTHRDLPSAFKGWATRPACTAARSYARRHTSFR
jgi:hypothetical protein